MVENYSDLWEVFEEASSVTSLTSNFLSFALAVLMIVALWRIYEKAGEHGWAALIPFYKDYVLYKVSGKKNMFWAYLVCSVLAWIAGIAFFVIIIVLAFSAMTPYQNNLSDDEYAMYGLAILATLFVLLVCGIVVLVLRILQCVGLAKCFGMSGGYAVGLIFLPHIFYSIFAFSSKILYYGPNGSYMNNPYGAPNGYNPQYGQYYRNQQYYGQPNQPSTPPYYSQPNQPNYGNQQYYGQPNQPDYGNQQYYGQPDQQGMASPSYEPTDNGNGDYSAPRENE